MPDTSLPTPTPPPSAIPPASDASSPTQAIAQSAPPASSASTPPTQSPLTPPTQANVSGKTSLPQPTAPLVRPPGAPTIPTLPGLAGLSARMSGAEQPSADPASRVAGQTTDRASSTAAPTNASPTNGSPTTNPAPTRAVAKSGLIFSPRILMLVLGVLAVVGLVAIVLWWLMGRSSSSTPTTTTDTQSNSTTATAGRTTVTGDQMTLTYWGLWEPSEVLTQVLSNFEQANPGIKVTYVRQAPNDYRERLQTVIASGSGPDLFRYHATWVPMLRNELAPLPTSLFTAADYQRIFYPVAARQLQHNGQLVGVPLMYDGLALLYNKEVLRSASAEPPSSWSALKTLANQLTVREGAAIQRSGVALGNATNVDHFSDILGLLMLQNGADFTNPTSQEAQDALTFYTNFQKVDRVWDETLPSSTVAFARGDVAMIFAPSWRIHEIQAMNPNLDFGVAPLPKLSETRLTWATYWAEGVSAQSKQKDAAWKLLAYLSSADVMRQLYSNQSQIRGFGELYSRTDLADQLAGNELVAPYVQDAPSAQSWYLSSDTHDSGINDQIIKYYQDAVNAVLAGTRSPADALITVGQGVQQVLRQFGVATTTPPVQVR